jgi:membrane protein YqaA with SNARE-associated domain
MVQQHLLKALLFLAAFLLVVAYLGIHFEEELMLGATLVVERIGFAGLAGILLVTDTLVTPFPPDLLLLVIANSPLAEHWWFYVSLLGLVSVAAGMLGWGIGRWLGHLQPVQRLFGGVQEHHREFIRRYGFWAVVLGAITPLPYSVTCWTAGMLGLRGLTVLLASLCFRAPRFLLYYWLLTSAGSLFG